MRLLLQYNKLDLSAKMQLLEVVANVHFRLMLEAEKLRLKDKLLSLAAGGDTVQFMLDYAVAQNSYTEVKSLLEDINKMHTDISVLIKGE